MYADILCIIQMCGMFVTGVQHSLLLKKNLLLPIASPTMLDSTHILHDEYICLPSSKWSKTITSKTNG